MTDIELPIELNPPLKGYLGYAYPLSVLFADGREALPWVLSNFIQMVGPRDGSCFYFHTPPGWWLNTERLFKEYYMEISKDQLDRDFGAVKAVLLHMLRRGYYVAGVFNEYYVPHRFSYHRKNFIHDYLLYGYREREDCFRILGYTDKKHYEPSDLSSEQLWESIRYNEPERFTMHFFQKDPARSYAFDLPRVIALLTDYLECRNTDRTYGEDFLFGVDACRNLKTYLGQIRERKGRIEPEMFYALREHKDCMLTRVRYLTDRGMIPPDGRLEEGIRDLIGQADFMLSLCLRWNLLHDPVIADDIGERVDRLVDREIPLLTTLRDRLAERLGEEEGGAVCAG